MNTNTIPLSPPYLITAAIYTLPATHTSHTLAFYEEARTIIAAAAYLSECQTYAGLEETLSSQASIHLAQDLTLNGFRHIEAYFFLTSDTDRHSKCRFCISLDMRITMNFHEDFTPALLADFTSYIFQAHPDLASSLALTDTGHIHKGYDLEEFQTLSGLAEIYLHAIGYEA